MAKKNRKVEGLELQSYDSYFYQNKNIHLEDECLEDECLVEEELYNIDIKCFLPRDIRVRNNDFFFSQKAENYELEKLLDEIDELRKK